MTVYSLSSTNIDQSALNLVKMYAIIRSQISLIMDLIRPDFFELSALELENLPYLTLFTLTHRQILTNQYQTWPQYICPSGLRRVRLWNKWNQNVQSFFVLEFRKITESDFVYTLASININQSAPNLVKMYVTIRTRMRLIINLIRPELSE